MLLNEFLKEHRKNEEQEATIDPNSRRKSSAQNGKRQFKRSRGLQKVSARLEASKPAPQVVNNSISERYFTISRHASPRGGFLLHACNDRGSLNSPACSRVESQQS